MLFQNTANRAINKVSTALIAMDRVTKIGLMLAADAALLPICFMIAMLVRLGNFPSVMDYGVAPYVLITVITISAFFLTGLYGAVVRFIDQRLFTATGIGLAVVVAVTYSLSSLFDYKGLPHSAVMIYWFIAFSYVVSSRLLASTLLRRARLGMHPQGACTVAIYGAGEAGVKLARAMRLSEKYRAVCFFDDKESLNNRNVAGLKVLHSQRIFTTVRERNIELIIIAIPSATPEQRRRIIGVLHQTDVRVKTLYSLMELADEEITAHSIRELKIDDLLGREPIQPQMDLFKKCVQGQNILVIGAGGSIGSELSRQILKLMPKEVHLLDHCEYALYNISQELTARSHPFLIRSHLGSACNASLVERIVHDYKIETIYHAAAYKHVPLVEMNIAEGIRNNILSASVVAEAAEKYRVKTCVLISSDKAVRPTSVMGASKRIAELIFQAAATKSLAGTKFCMVRFGNVLGSSGSVVPLFKSQIERGGPITITHPDVVRYFMSIPEAAQLVMQAGAMATGGDVFVMDMGEPVKIVDLARTMIAMSGLAEKSVSNPNGDIEIQFIGLRRGEKLYEELFSGDNPVRSKHPRILTTTEYNLDPNVLAQHVAYLMVACDTNDTAMIKFLTQKIVTGYTPELYEDPTQQVDLTRKEPELSIENGLLRLLNKSS